MIQSISPDVINYLMSCKWTGIYRHFTHSVIWNEMNINHELEKYKNKTFSFIQNKTIEKRLRHKKNSKKCVVIRIFSFLLIRRANKRYISEIFIW